MLEIYDVPGRGLALYDPQDPLLPNGAVKVENAKPKAEAKAAPKPKTKAVKPENK